MHFGFQGGRRGNVGQEVLYWPRVRAHVFRCVEGMVKAVCTRAPEKAYSAQDAVAFKVLYFLMLLSEHNLVAYVKPQPGHSPGVLEA